MSKIVKQSEDNNCQFKCHFLCKKVKVYLFQNNIDKREHSKAHTNNSTHKSVISTFANMCLLVLSLTVSFQFYFNHLYGLVFTF